MRNPFWRAAVRRLFAVPSRPAGRGPRLGLELPLEPRVVPTGTKVATVAPPVLTAPAMPGLVDLKPQIAGAVVRAWSVAPGTQTTRWVVTLEPGVATTGLTNLGATLTPVPYWSNAYVAEFASPRDVAGFPAALAAAGGAAWFYPLIARQQSPRTMPNDSLINNQWHLKNTGQGGGTVGADANVEPVYTAGITGAGVTIAVVDDGLRWQHPDISPNYDAADSYDFNSPTPGGDPDPTPDSGDAHGTSAGGVAAAQGNNGIGVAGAAYDANLAGIRLISAGVDDATEAAALTYHANAIDIYTNSWGPADDAARLEGPGPLLLAAFESAYATGRNGKGNIYTWAAGNGLGSNDNVNYDGYANSRFVVAVGAVTNTDQQASYSEPGASMLVTAYSNGGTRGITTTTSPTGYVNDFGGTSSATPLVAGVIGLMLDANPNLTARDVQNILVRSAEKVNASDSGWTTNGAGLPINHKYGFGGIDAQAAVARATTWAPVGAELSTSSGFQSVGTPIPDGVGAGQYGAPVTAQTTLTSNIQVEHVEVIFSATHTYRGDLEVVLTAPSGTESVLATQHGDGGANYNTWTFTTVRDWGESAAGTWQLRVRDGYNTDVGTFDGWQLIVYGITPPAPPALGGSEPEPLRYLENQPAALEPGIVVSDADSAALAGATVAITAGFDAAEDRLLFTNQNGISGAFANGTLTLSGAATVVQYQTALRSVQYDNLSENPAPVSRTIAMSVRDAAGLSSQTVTREVNVYAVNDAPSFTAGPNIVVLQDSGPQVNDPWATNLLAGPPAESAQTVGLELLSNSAPGLFSAGPVLSPTGALSFTPAPGANGVATLQIVARDNGGVADGGIDTSAPRTVSITLTPRPTVVPDSYTTGEDVPLVVSVPGVAGNDLSPTGLPLIATLVTPPAHGTLALAPDGSFTYTPAANYHGPDGFTYTVGDGVLESVPGPVSIRVLSVNDLPVAVDDTAATPGGRPLFLSLLANDTDADGDGLAVLGYTAAAHGRLTRSGSGLLYTPTPGYQGADGFTYTVADGRGGTDTGSVNIAVTDATAPKVVAVRARYGPAGGHTLDLAGLSRGALPWDSVSRIEIAFSEAVALAGSALTLNGPTGPVTLSFALSADGRLGTWTVPGTGLETGRYTLRLSAAAVTDSSPNANPLTRDYARTFAVLPGDFDGNGVVNSKDVSGIKKKYNSNPAKVNSFADLNGDGVVDKTDAELAAAKFGTRLS